jgi:inward rectifier potassium channel
MRVNKAKTENNTGLSTDGTNNAGRYYVNNSQPNVTKKNVPFLKQKNLYHYLIHLNNYKFLLIIFLGFFLLNLFFAGLYALVGYNQLQGINEQSAVPKFSQVFFFSCQTFTTVGYGGIHPIGFIASAISSLESLVGLLSFALITGLLYGRFSRPRAFIKFANNILIAPYKDGIALMVRCAPYTNHVLSNVKATITLAIKEPIINSAKKANRFYTLPLEIEFISSFILSWTLVHPIDEHSPLYNIDINYLKENQFELLVFINAFDESFSNQVVSRNSFVADDIIWGAKFLPMIAPNENSSKTELDFAKLNDIENVKLPI